MEFLVLTMFIPIVAIIGGIIIGALALHHRARLRELAYRERIAMIERGLVPPPEADPGRFERTFGDVSVDGPDGPGARALRHRTAGVVLLAIGLGLMLIIGLAGEAPATALGVGGAVIVIGAAGIINSIFIGQDEARRAYEARRRAAQPKPPATENDVRE